MSNIALKDLVIKGDMATYIVDLSERLPYLKDRLIDNFQECHNLPRVSHELLSKS